MIECVLIAGLYFYNIGPTGVVYDTSILPVESTTVKIDHKHHRDETTVIFVSSDVWDRVDVEYDPTLTALDIVSLCE